MIFHLSVWPTVAILVGYAVCEYIDQWKSNRAKERVIEDELYGWKLDSNDSEYEEKGNLSRIKLVGHEQIIVTRVAEILRRIP